MHKATVNNSFKFDLEQKGGQLYVNGNVLHADVNQLNSHASHVILDHQSYNAEVVIFDAATKTAEIKVNGNTYTVSVKDQFDLLLEKMGLSSLAGAKISEIKAPMPGLVLNIFVKEGDEVKKGENLFTLEAMKMENIIKSPADVVIKTIKIASGDKVEKGQVLIHFA